MMERERFCYERKYNFQAFEFLTQLGGQTCVLILKVDYLWYNNNKLGLNLKYILKASFNTMGI